MKLLLVFAMLAQQQAPLVTPRAGLVITRSVRLRPGVYRLAAPPSGAPLIIVRGTDITVDFNGAELVGSDPEGDPDLAAGVAVLVDSGRNVRLRRPVIRGYLVGIRSRGTRGLAISGGNLSHNWKPRLFSLVEHESLVDWLSFHRNERREWLRFGAAIYLEDVRGGVIEGNRAVQGMNALLMVRSDSLRIERNDFSFNSGLGIGLYRSSDNLILYNTADYNVRGYSHGFYRRGQDSAGLLLYEQSCRNIVAWNSATHGGDGLFLWAGQSTMDSGTGGANDNLFFGNDFSFAPANGIEATFSRNAIVDNLLEGNEYGVWGGYSFSSRIHGNQFVRNRTGIAIEHGQDNVIGGNRFSGDSTAIRLWANPIEPSDWGYPRFRDTRSRDVLIDSNLFAGNRVAVRAASTARLAMAGNTWWRVDSALVLSDTSAFTASSNVVADGPEPAFATSYPELFESMVRGLGGPRAIPSSGRRRLDRSAIVVDEWGPYDRLSPKLWPLDSTRSNPLRLVVLGPEGEWRLASRRGVTAISRAAGGTGDTITVAPATPGDWEIGLEFRGGPTVSPRGRRRAAGAVYPFGWGRFEPAIAWTVRFVTWADSTSPTGQPDAFARLFQRPLLLTLTVPRLDWLWFRPTIAELPRERWALEATGTVTLPAGRYSLRTISDDGVRVWVNGRLVIDNWTGHDSAVDHAPLAGGRHRLRVQYYQKDGWTELRLDIVRGRTRSAGSPGPH